MQVCSGALPPYRYSQRDYHLSVSIPDFEAMKASFASCTPPKSTATWSCRWEKYPKRLTS